MRECAEEIGLDLNSDSLRFHEREFIEDFIQDVWIAPWDGDETALKIDPEEVLQVKQLSWEEILAMADDASFIQYGEGYFSRLKKALGGSHGKR